MMTTETNERRLRSLCSPDTADIISFTPGDRRKISHSKHRHGLPFCLVTTMHGY
jgi:hypothetical protein